MAKYKAIITQRDGTCICLESYDVDIKSKRVFLNCSNCGALLELGETKREKKGGANER